MKMLASVFDPIDQGGCVFGGGVFFVKPRERSTDGQTTFTGRSHLGCRRSVFAGDPRREARRGKVWIVETHANAIVVFNLFGERDIAQSPKAVEKPIKDCDERHRTDRTRSYLSCAVILAKVFKPIEVTEQSWRPLNLPVGWRYR
ncbi:hypothetical protein ACJ51O_35725 (plasmid) [Burkholderia pyrrocinia]|uniref:hypothetical protein n=1 Tax=Burkholderia pyrrocinia TaxID=60550 RepID=UPI0038B46915